MIEAKPDYKRTAAGYIPHDWHDSTIGECVHFSGGTQPPRTTFTFSPSADNVRLVQIRDYKSDEFATYIPKVLARKFCSADDIMIGRYGPPVFQILRGIEGAYNVALIKATNLQNIDREFLYYVLSQTSLFNLIDSLSRRTSGQTGVEMPALRAFPLPLPPPSEQRAIAKALGDVDGLIASFETLIAKKRDIKQGAMQEFLSGHHRLPGFKGEWEVKRLGDVVEKLIGGGTPSRTNPAFWGNEIPWVTVKDFATFDPRRTQECITHIGLKNSASHLIPKGTLITSTRMALGMTSIYNVDVAINQDLKAIFLKSNTSVKFLFYWFEKNAQAIDSLGSGSTVKGISVSQLSSFPFRLPSLGEQTAIAEILSDMDDELTALEAKLAKTRDVKQGMMQVLLTGEVRLV
jgi:type I restriction enzyme, S subunit